jgi:hypothetical protein
VISPGRHRLAAVAALATAAAAVVVVAVLVAPTSCTSNCATNCPLATVYIGSLNNQQLYITDIVVEGPACPPQYGIYCVGDGVTTSCTHTTITGTAQGYCNVKIVFPDRPAENIHLEFGPPIQQGCCKGYSIVGDSVFIISTSSDAGIGGVDGASDQVMVVVDGGADAADGGADAADGGTADGGPSP